MLTRIILFGASCALLAACDNSGEKLAPPTALTYSSPSAVYTVGSPIAPNTPSASGGAIAAYAISPPLPEGLRLDAATGVIDGTPSVAAPGADYTVTAKNARGSATAIVNITVHDAPPEAPVYATNPAVYTKGVAITPNAPTASGGPVVSYTVEPALPAGLSLDGATGVLSGTPSELSTPASYTISAESSGGSTTVLLSLAVVDVPPATLSYPVSLAVYTKGVAITPNAPSVEGGPVESYAVSPALPAGLGFDTASGVVSGTPEALAVAADYTVTAANSGGTATTILGITVIDVPPVGLTYATPAAILMTGQPIADNTPSSSGGAVVTYSVTPALPAGLSLDVASGVISGTPLEASVAIDYTVTASNSGGFTTTTINLEVFGPPDPGTSSLTPEIAAVPADGASTLALTLVLKDLAGHVLAAEPVSFTSSAAGDVFSPDAGATDAAGQLVTAAAASSFGLRTIEAHAGGVVVSAGVSFTGLVCGAPTTSFMTSEDLTFDVGVAPIDLAVGDFDRDGAPDVVTADVFAGTVSIMLGLGDGTFDSPTAIPVGTYPYSVVTADLDRDGETDLAVALRTDNQVAVLLGNGDGTFQAPDLFAAGSMPQAVTAMDLDRDGWLDLAVANSSVAGDVSVLLGSGDGSFEAPVSYDAHGGHPYAIASGDFDGDGAPDVATVNYNGNKLITYLGAGDGTLGNGTDHWVGAYPISLTVADFDRDGALDLATGNHLDDFSVVMGKGDGTFNSPENYKIGSDISNPSPITSGDFDGDGLTDLAIGVQVDQTVSVLRGLGTGVFEAPLAYDVNSAPHALATADLDGDGRLDLVGAYNFAETIRVLLNQTPAAAATYESGMAAFAGEPTSVTSGDFDGDGALDLVVASHVGDTVNVHLGNRDGTFQPPSATAVGSGPTSVLSADLDGDGRVDLATTDGSGVSVALGNGDGSFQAAVAFLVGSLPASVLSADFDRNGTPDLATANRGDDTVSVLLGAGDGAFQPAIAHAAGSSPHAVASADLDHDGKPDLVTANRDDDTVSVLLGQGDGTFEGAVSYVAGGSPESVVIGDVDGDAQLDLAVANQGTSSVSVLLGNGDGTFQAAVDHAVGNSPRAVITGDFNRDGVADLATADAGSNQLSLLLGDGAGGFLPALVQPMGQAPSAVTSADFNGDGRPDFAVANSGSGDVRLLVDTGCSP